ncbi:MAG: hypothetical protein JO125_15840 [Chloroflexi bacterium]|nr:hypothetical protein [Ktedonobacteraceae bacterium]MBV9021810.1 hypothetical protein [Ktedonobacteraceae bacterium]MBV9708867.1 hypothetical protein [Chloroflexota bacterium]
MSQQEQEQQGSQAGQSDNRYAPYYWSTKSEAGKMPKTDHPLSYEETIPPYSYQAQDRAEHIYTQQEEVRQDIPQYGSRPYNMQPPQWQQVPPWARPQRNKKGMLRWIVLIVLGLLLIKPLLILVGILLASVGIVLFVVLLPILIIFGILLAIAVTILIVLAVLGMPLHFGWLWRAWNR